MAKKPQNKIDENERLKLAKVLVKESGSNIVKESMRIYGMEVIENRAIPSIITGLKPVQQKILCSMDDLGLYHNKPFVKCARIVGDVMGRRHP